jgi:methyl-accepting chemotaxis protein
MAEQKKLNRGRHYIIDSKAQIGPTSQIVTTLIIVCSVFAVGLLYFTKDNPLFEMDAAEFRGFILQVFALYLLVSVTIFSVMVISLTHRFVGPANVIQRALNGILEGEYSHRVTLRRKDHLKSLADSVNDVREKLRVRQENRLKLLANLERCLVERDLSAASELVQRLREEPVEEPALEQSEPAPEAASTTT